MPEISCPLAESALRVPDSVAIVHDSNHFRYGDLDILANRIAEYLSKEGIKAQDNVGLVGNVNARWIAGFFALLRLGAVACPLSTKLPDNALSETAGHFGLQYILLIDSSAQLSSISSVTNLTLPSSDILPSGDSEASHTLIANQPSTAILTSGSSSLPKAALHTLGNHVYSARGVNAYLKFGTDDRWLLSLPVHHVAGLAVLFRTIVAGATLVFPRQDESFFGAIDSYHITHLSLVSTQLREIMNNPEQLEKARSHLKAILLGGSAFPKDLLERAVESKLPVFLSYGLTEMSSTVTACRVANPLTLSCGQSLPYRKVRIAKSGEIEVAGETLFLGYLGESGNSLTDDGWFRTGDCGLIDDNDELFVTGRLDNLIISGGENIRPEEIESALLAIESISEAVVVPIDDERFGQRPVAFVRVADNAEIDEKGYRRFLSNNFEPFKIPDYFFDLPPDNESENIKPNRAELIALARRLLKSSDS